MNNHRTQLCCIPAAPGLPPAEIQTALENTGKTIYVMLFPSSHQWQQEGKEHIDCFSGTKLSPSQHPRCNTWLGSVFPLCCRAGSCTQKSRAAATALTEWEASCNAGIQRAGHRQEGPLLCPKPPSRVRWGHVPDQTQQTQNQQQSNRACEDSVNTHLK